MGTVIFFFCSRLTLSGSAEWMEYFTCTFFIIFFIFYDIVGIFPPLPYVYDTPVSYVNMKIKGRM